MLVDDACLRFRVAWFYLHDSNYDTAWFWKRRNSRDNRCGLQESEEAVLFKSLVNILSFKFQLDAINKNASSLKDITEFIKKNNKVPNSMFVIILFVL